MATYLVQIVDEPHQTVALKVQRAVPIVLPLKDVAELIMKLRRRPVEAMESLKEIW